MTNKDEKIRKFAKFQQEMAKHDAKISELQRKLHRATDKQKSEIFRVLAARHKRISRIYVEMQEIV